MSEQKWRAVSNVILLIGLNFALWVIVVLAGGILIGYCMRGIGL